MTNKSILRLGTRGSKLAMAQALAAKAKLEEGNADLHLEIVPIRTSGDQGNREVLGAFVREIESALLDDRIDLALHCLKDLPTRATPGLVFAAHLERDDPRDALISPAADLAALAPGSVLGTGSLRRTSQLRHLRKDLVFRPLVGNVDTRLRKLQEGEYQAIVLALAGFNRLGLKETWSSEYPGLNLTPLPYDSMLPAPGQAVLVLQCREKDEAAYEAANVLDCTTTRQCAIAERKFLEAFGGGCSVPVAALCQVVAGEYVLRGLVTSPDGEKRLVGEKYVECGEFSRTRQTKQRKPQALCAINDPEGLRGQGRSPLLNPDDWSSKHLGQQLAEDLLAQGAANLFQGVVR